MTGLKREQIIGKKVTEALPGIEKDPTDLIGIYGRVALTGEPVQFENHVEPLGTWYNVSAYCPEKGYFVALLEDVTDRKKAEEALAREAELIDLSPDAIVVRTFEGTITFWSKGAENLYGWTKDEAIGKVTHKLFKTEFPIPLEQIEKMQRLQGKWSGELTHTRKDGGKVVVQSFQLCQFSADGKIESILESNIDITERKQQEREIKNLARFPSENPNPIFRIDKKGTILYGNQAGASFLAAWNSKVGKPCTKVY
jgi:PAS domain S-box-containing protein